MHVVCHMALLSRCWFLALHCSILVYRYRGDGAPDPRIPTPSTTDGLLECKDSARPLLIFCTYLGLWYQYFGYTIFVHLQARNLGRNAIS